MEFVVEWETPDEGGVVRRRFDDPQRAAARFSRLTSLFYSEMYFGAEVRLLEDGRVVLREVIG